MNYKVSDIFDIIGEANITNEYINQHKGAYPVYSGQTKNDGIFGYIDTYKYDEEMILWATYGANAGKVFLRNGKYNIGRNACGLRVKDNFKDSFNLKYLSLILEQKFHNARKTSAGFGILPQSIVKSIELAIINSIEEQNKIIEKDRILNDLKSKIILCKENLDNVSVELEFNDICHSSVAIGKIFEVKAGNSNLQKSFIEKNKGEYPVYSANTKENGVFGYINTFDHDIECVQITTNGYAGTAFYREKHKFSINPDARLYIPKNANLDCLYLSFELQRVLSKHNFNWEYKPTIERTKNLEIKIPITKTGEFDLERQKEIAEKYRKIEEIKKNIKAELEKIENIKVDLGL